MPLFKSREAETIETVRTKLEAARAELAAQEQYLAEIALENALAEGETPQVTEAQAKVRQLRDRIELLEAAITEAERLERSRLARARAEADATRLRALRQHDAAAVKAAKGFEAAAEAMVKSWNRIVEAIESRNRLLHLGEERVKTSAIRFLALAEIARADHAAGGRNAPGTPDRREYDHVVALRHHVSEAPDFSAALEQRLLASFRSLGGSQ